MGLLFKCQNCGAEIKVMFLVPGDDAVCNKCGAHNKVPEDAAKVISENYNQPYSGVSSDSNSRSAVTGDSAIGLNPQNMQVLEGFARVLIIALALSLLLNLVSIWSSYLQLDLLLGVQGGKFCTESEALANDSRENAIGLISFCFYVLTSVAFLFWFYRAHNNLKLAGIPQLKYKSGWTIGGFLVPILNLFRPYQVMAEVWQGSSVLNSTEYELHISIPVDGIVKLWWTGFAIIMIFTRIVDRIAARTESLEGLINLTGLMMLLEFLWLGVTIVTILMVNKITALQSEAMSGKNTAYYSTGAT